MIFELVAFLPFRAVQAIGVRNQVKSEEERRKRLVRSAKAEIAELQCELNR